jgi:flavin reductase (DIM6/NTAB) family NADH-FMN oxidoreductase RutF
VGLWRQYELSIHKDLYYFSKAAGFIELRVEHLVETEGDHVLLLGKVVQGKNLVDGPILTTAYLKKHKYIR